MTDQLSLFGSDDPPSIQKNVPPAITAREPLAARMRPHSLDEIVGQEHLLRPDRILRRSIESDEIHRFNESGTGSPIPIWWIGMKVPPVRI